MSNKEIWKDVAGFEGHYMVSSIGNVKSVDKKVKGGKSGLKLKKGKILKQITTYRGYKRVSMSRDGKSKHFFVHRLMAIAFLENPENKPYINHKDGKKINNVIDNIEWCTPQENSIHLYHVLKYSLPPESRERSNEYQRKRMVALGKPIKCIEDNALYISVQQAADTYGITRRGIRWLIQNNKTSKSGKTFCYA
jgi:hypothetical protein